MATCIVSGMIKDASETAIAGAVVKANVVTPYFTSTVHIVPKELETTTAADGSWSLTLGQSRSFRISIEYPPNGSDSRKQYSYSIITPATGTANFSTLATES